MTNKRSPISNYFTAIADLLGLPASEFRTAVDVASNIWDKAKSDKLKEQENLIRHEGVHRRLIRSLLKKWSSCNPPQQRENRVKIRQSNRQECHHARKTQSSSQPI